MRCVSPVFFLTVAIVTFCVTALCSDFQPLVTCYLLPVLSSAASLALPYFFPRYLINGMIFGGEGVIVEYIINVHRCPREVTVILVEFKCNLNFIDRQSKYKISWISVQWERSCSMRTDRHDEVS